jgi:hypothetical protein
MYAAMIEFGFGHHHRVPPSQCFGTKRPHNRAAMPARSISGNSLMAVQSATHQRRALELLAVSGRQGCTEAFLLAHGFTLDLLTDMIRAGLATAQFERARAGSQTRLHITDAGRRALRDDDS